MSDFEELKPLNEDEEGVLYLGPLTILDLDASADLIAEIMDPDTDINRIFCLGWRNAQITMRVGSWRAIIERDVLV